MNGGWWQQSGRETRLEQKARGGSGKTGPCLVGTSQGFPPKTPIITNTAACLFSSGGGAGGQIGSDGLKAPVGVQANIEMPGQLGAIFPPELVRRTCVETFGGKGGKGGADGAQDLPLSLSIWEELKGWVGCMYGWMDGTGLSLSVLPVLGYRS